MSKKQETKQTETKPVAQETKQMVVPEYMKKFMEQSQEDTESLMTSSMSVPRISYRGKRFRFIENGEEELAKEMSIKVVILGVEPGAGLFLKTYYDTGYQPGSSDPPTCSSSDGLKPDSWVSSPQANLCRQCPQNVFGSATSVKGGKAKACKDGKRLWVARSQDLEKYYGLNIPVMSLKNLSEYGKYIAKNKYPLSLVVTEIGLDDNSEFPQLTFQHAGFVQETMVETITKMNTERPWALPATTNQRAISPAPAPAPAAAAAEGPKPPIGDVLNEW